MTARMYTEKQINHSVTRTCRLGHKGRSALQDE